MAASVLVGSSDNVISQAPSPNVSVVDYCAPGSPARDVTLLVGDVGRGVGLPRHFSNGTDKPVTFTTTMKTNRLFGPELVVDRLTVPPGRELVLLEFHRCG